VRGLLMASTERDAIEQQNVWNVGRIAALVGGNISGDANTMVTGVSGIDTAESGDIVFAESDRYLETAVKSNAVAIMCRPDQSHTTTKPLIHVNEPRLAFLKLLSAFSPAVKPEPGIDPTAVVAAGALFGEGVYVGPLVSIGEHVKIGDRVCIQAGVHIGDSCVIDDDTILYPNVVLYPSVTVGKRCYIHAGAVLGADGFGYAPVGNMLQKVPHIGSVRVEDDVEIGANCCIDRAKTEETVIGAGTKMDNLVHIAHNVKIGKCCVIVSQVGIAGSTTIGNGVILAGQVGIVDHVNVGDGAQVGAQSGVRYDIPAGGRFFGSPAVPMARRLKEISIKNKLPDIMKEFRGMQKRIQALEAALHLEATDSPSAADATEQPGASES